MTPEKDQRNKVRRARGAALTLLATVAAAACTGSDNQQAVGSHPAIVEADRSSEIVLTPEERKAKEDELAEFETLIKEYFDTDVDKEYWEGVFNLRNASDKELSEQFVVEPHGHQDGVDYYIRFPDPERKPSTFLSVVRNSKGEVFALIYSDKRNYLNQMTQAVPGSGIAENRMSVDRVDDPVIDVGLIMNMPIKNMPPGLIITPWESNEMFNERQVNVLGSTGVDRTYLAPDGTRYSQHILKNGERTYSFFNRSKADQ